MRAIKCLVGGVAVLFCVCLLLQSRVYQGQRSLTPELLDRYEQPIIHGKWYSQLNVSDLPLWEQHVEGKPWCDAASQLYDGLFYKSTHGEILYEPNRCRIHRLTAQQARSCLTNKTILMVGDSITRYHYMTFAHFLARGQYAQRYGDDISNPSVCMEKQFASWSEFYARTSSLLTVAATDMWTKESCDCHRPLDNNQLHLAREHRRLDINLRGRHPGTIHLIFNQTLRWPSVHRGAYDSLQRSLKTFHVDIALVNVGAWITHTEDIAATKSAELFQPLFHLPRKFSPHTRLIWRSMSAGGHLPRAVKQGQLLTSMARYYNWEVLDSWFLTDQAARQRASMRWDHVHFLPAMYDQWTDLLLQTVCPAPSAGTW